MSWPRRETLSPFSDSTSYREILALHLGELCGLEGIKAIASKADSSSVIEVGLNLGNELLLCFLDLVGIPL